MATYSSNNVQASNEVKTYTIDYTLDLPTGGTVTGASAMHVPPAGTASSVATSVSHPYVYATLPAQSVAGVHYVDVLATFSNSDKSPVRIEVNVVYPTATARSGMGDLISELRSMANAGASDYTVAGVPYWTDAQLQRILDNHRVDLRWNEMETMPGTPDGSGDLDYLEYSIGYGNLEQTTGGTAIFMVQDINGNAVDASEYSVDYQRGVVTFNADTEGFTYWVTARSYDLEGAAGDVWKRKQGHYHTAINFSSDNNSMSREALYQHAKEMADFYSSLGEEGMTTVDVMRSDTDGADE